MRRTGGRVALQGNLDPTTLYASPDAIAAAAARVLDTYAAGNGGSREGHVFNLGHGMSPDMDPAHVQVLVDACTRTANDEHSACRYGATLIAP